MLPNGPLGGTSPKHAPAKHGHEKKKFHDISKSVKQVFVLELIPMW
jgi:hypothetical protein